MPRDPGLEELVHSALGDQTGVTGKAMFGGWAFLLHGNLLCGVRRGSLMLRVGRDNEDWALRIPGVAPVEMRGREPVIMTNGCAKTVRQALRNQ